MTFRDQMAQVRTTHVDCVQRVHVEIETHIIIIIIFNCLYFWLQWTYT